MSERVEHGAPVREEPHLDPPQRGRPEHVVLEGGERHAEAGNPRRDGERARVHGLAGELRTDRGVGGGEDVTGEDPRGERVVGPALPGPVGDP